MPGFFPKRASAERTVLIVDIENGSVGCALVRLCEGQPPKLFSEVRTALPLLPSVSAASLLRETDRALREALVSVSTTAARLRNHSSLASAGAVSSAAVFVAPPWTRAKMRDGVMMWNIETALVHMAESAVVDAFGDIPVHFQALSAASMHAADVVFGQIASLLICTVGGEVSELSLMQDGALRAHATMPTGSHSLERTLRTHAGLSRAEAHSALKLDRMARLENATGIALSAAARHFAEHFSDAASQFGDMPALGILIIAHEPAGEWIAQNIAGSERLSRMFPLGATVQALRTHHVVPHLSGHAARPDMALMLEALFVDARMTGI